MATLKYIIRPDKVRGNGEAPLYLRITQNRKSRFISTGIYLPEKDWNRERQQVRKTHPNYEKLNDHLQTELMQAQGKVMQGRQTSPDKLKAAITGNEQAGDMLATLQDYIDNLKADGKYWQWKHYTVLLKKFNDEKKGFAPGGLTFAEFDGDRLKKFERHLRTECGNGKATIYKALSRLKAFFSHLHKTRIVKLDNNPFLGYPLINEPSANKTRLGITDIEALAAIELKPDSWPDVARDSFLFAFYCAGIRFGDLCRLQWDNIRGKRLVYVMAKNGKQVDIPIMPQARGIIKKYEGRGTFIFPLLHDNRDYSDPLYVRRTISSRNAYVNRLLLQLRENAGIQGKFSFHTARHSFADYGRKMKLDTYTISKLLQHSSLTITEKYLASMDQTATDTGMNIMFKNGGNG